MIFGRQGSLEPNQDSIIHCRRKVSVRHTNPFAARLKHCDFYSPSLTANEMTTHEFKGCLAFPAPHEGWRSIVHLFVYSSSKTLILDIYFVGRRACTTLCSSLTQLGKSAASVLKWCCLGGELPDAFNSISMSSEYWYEESVAFSMIMKLASMRFTVLMVAPLSETLLLYWSRLPLGRVVMSWSLIRKHIRRSWVLPSTMQSLPCLRSWRG